MPKIKTLSALIAFICIVGSVITVSAIGFNAEQAYKSVVVIETYDSLGSGFMISQSKIITNAHVVGDSKKVIVSVYKDDTTYTANVLAIDENIDLAVLELYGKILPHFKFADYNDLNDGADLYAIGAPENMQYSLTKGILSAKDREIGLYKYIQTDAAINFGNSGGPLLNDKGEVIGVNSLKMQNATGIGLAIPMTDVAKFLQEYNITVSEQGTRISTLAAKSDFKILPKTENQDIINSVVLDPKTRNIKNIILIVASAFYLIGICFLILYILKKKVPKYPKPYESELIGSQNEPEEHI